MKIGLEVHVQLPTLSKMFCSCPTTDADTPNTHVCPTCLGMPGSRPVMNRKAMEYGIMLAKMLDCRIADTVWFSRKTYFYPDMSKSVQITQYDNPVGSGGVYRLNGNKPIGITRIHLEEDPGKTKRVGDQSSLVDYNRSGIPLAEIVTEPDLSTPAEAREFLKQLIADIRHTIDLPDDGERSIRCDCNISVGKERCEVKNVTGLRNVERALTFEAVRQTKVLKAGGKIERETRRFDEERGVTVSVRKKEFEADYGYIDEPDLGIFRIGELARSISIKESPLGMTVRLVREYGIDEKTAKQMVSTSVDLAKTFEKIVSATGSTQTAVSWTVGAISANWKTFEAAGGDTDGIIDIMKRFGGGGMTDVEAGIELKAYMTGTDIQTVRDSDSGLDEIIDSYLDAHPEMIFEIRKNDKAVNRIIGHVMKETGGRYPSSDIVSSTMKIVNSKI
ncbi:MAG: Asp-tRNA(Asn)/Glu-tRNA(Gln) amidotransferase subunit GatB [Candidatus Methanoplasma sp.]|jgi:aspartyl-tRNA(Asn)/glutamyl-tRNA(Gln) amidotransferase subunit B|nr:Asp-tRNA(Asn)/Glu-tRNA(Gln) amidotransferase subunit GatB [Candidatus Methanoplasma sp.]